MKNIIYKVVLKPNSPLSIGSGLNDNTDSDVIVSRDGRPFIPATAIVGVLRSFLVSTDGVLVANSIFGYIPDSPEALEKAESGDERYQERKNHVRVSDALPADTVSADDFCLAVRHRVKLENKVAVKGAKFDMEAVEPGDNVCFTTFIELMDIDSDTWISNLEAALAAMNAGVIGLGADTSRGYGKVRLTVQKKVFNDVETWLDFEPDASGAWSENDNFELPSLTFTGLLLRVHLELVGALSIREYSTDVGAPDYAATSLHKKVNEHSDGKSSGKSLEEKWIPFIPGTSWAGAFRERFSLFAKEEKTKELFGYVEKDGSRKARIAFSESQLSGGVFKDVTRNSLDRFSMATKDGALYTERTYYGGATVLDICLADEPDEETAAALGICLMDLHRGFLAIGGLTAVGRGLFRVTGLETVRGDGVEELTDAFQAISADEPELSDFVNALVHKEEAKA